MHQIGVDGVRLLSCWVHKVTASTGAPTSAGIGNAREQAFQAGERNRNRREGSTKRTFVNAT